MACRRKLAACKSKFKLNEVSFFFYGCDVIFVPGLYSFVLKDLKLSGLKRSATLGNYV